MKNSDIVLTSSQQDALACINTFLKRDVSSVFMLKGYAGTGKTQVTRHLVQQLKDQGRSVRMMTPTGRAARILNEQTGKEATTIHRAIFTFERDEHSEQEYRIHFKLDINTDSSDAVYIVDEASMIANQHDGDEFIQFGSGRLLQDLITFADPYQSNRKLIFVGDPAQLPPVKMSMSPALDTHYLRKNFQLESEEFILDQVIRQKEGTGLYRLLTELRDQLNKSGSVQIDMRGDYQTIKTDHRRKTLDWYIDRHRQEDPDVNWVVATNKKARLLSDEVRGALRLHYDTIADRDLLLVTRNCYHQDVLMLNGDLIRVISSSDRVEHHHVVFNYRDEEKIKMELRFREALVEPESGEEQVNVLILENSLEEMDLQKLSTALYVDFRNRHRYIPKSEIKGMKSTDPYLNALLVKYGYAMTCHKAQGGEWKHVVADMDHQASSDKEAFIRWAYTAASRASEELRILNPVVHHPAASYVMQAIQTQNKRRPQMATDDIMPAEEGDPPEFHEFPFLKGRIQRVEQNARDEGWTIYSERMPYCLRFEISDNANNAVVDLHYGKKGFSGNPKVRTNAGDAFINRVLEVLNRVDRRSSAPEFTPEESFRQQLFERIHQECNQLQITVETVLEEQWNDVYLLHTDVAGSELHCYYNKKGYYTRMIPKSRRGEGDRKLKELCNRLTNRQ